MFDERNEAIIVKSDGQTIQLIDYLKNDSSGCLNIIPGTTLLMLGFGHRVGQVELDA